MPVMPVMQEPNYDFEVLAIDSSVKHFNDTNTEMTISDINPDETRRLTDNLKSLLGNITRLLAKAPASVVGIGLVLNTIGPIIIDLVLQNGSGSILSQIFTEQNIGNIWAVLNSVLGSYFVFNTVSIFRKADDASNGRSGDLAVKRTCDSRVATLEQKVEQSNNHGLILTGKIALLNEKLADKEQENQTNQDLIRRLLELLQSKPDCSQKKIVDLLSKPDVGDQLNSTLTPGDIQSVGEDIVGLVDTMHVKDADVVSSSMVKNLGAQLSASGSGSITPLFQTCISESWSTDVPSDSSGNYESGLSKDKSKKI